jgi:hypothetical protein
MHKKYKVTKSSNSNIWFVIEEDEEGEKVAGSSTSLTKAKKRAVERKEIVGNKKIVTIEKIHYVVR